MILMDVEINIMGGMQISCPINKVILEANMAHNNDSVRNKLIEITNQGLMLKAIALNVGIDVNDLSRFKGGMECLKESEVEVLSEYLDAVVIPQWNMVIPGKAAKEVEISECDVRFGMPVMEKVVLSADKPKGILALEKLKAKRISK